MLRAAGGHLMRVLDLFSGIGGMSLGLQRAGMTTVAFCEIDPFCRRVLAKHWPEVPIYDDVRSLTAARLAADGIVFDLICGGFPCQDLSVAGRGAGLSGERSGLWFEFCRIIEETRPGWTLIENVPALRSRGLDIVLGGLAALGYDAEWHCIPAAAGLDGVGCGLIAPPSATIWVEEPDIPRVAVGVPNRVARLKALGNGVVPQIPELIGRAIMARQGAVA